MRRVLDSIYLGAAWIAASAIFAIALLVSGQVLLNFATRALGLPLPSSIPSYADFSGFLLAGATFLAMPWTLRSGGHIRVSLLTSRVRGRARAALEILVLGLAAALVAYLGVYIVLLVGESLHYGDVSSGMVAVPLWFPQSVIALGIGLLFVAIVDSLFETAKTGRPAIDDGEDV